MHNISICIPTYNRAQLLRKSLSHLMTFSSTNFELVIGDNASTDDTEKVVQEFSSLLPHVVYLRHQQNIGPQRNADSIARRATRKYLYVIPDDDLVFENALLVMSNILENSASAVAVNGPGLTQGQTLIGMKMDFTGGIATTYNRGNFVALASAVASSLGVCDGNPFMRREIFQRYCAFQDRLSGLSVYFTLLAHGDYIRIDKPVYQHFRNPESLSSNMADPSFIDMFVADIEVALSDLKGSLPPDTTEKIRIHTLQVLYYQAARMCRIKKDYTMLWLFLRRAKSVGVLFDDSLSKFEICYLIEAVLDRLVRVIADLEVSKIQFWNTPVMQGLIILLQKRMPNVMWHSCDDPALLTDNINIMVEKYDDIQFPESSSNIVIAFMDVLVSLRLTSYPIEVTLNGNNELTLVFSDQSGQYFHNLPSPHFMGLHAPWANSGN